MVRDLSIAQEFKRRAIEAMPRRVAKIVLYGSRARGDARKDSDWDVAVFIKGRPTPRDRSILSHISFDLLMETGEHVQAFPLSHQARESGLQLLPKRLHRRHRCMMDEQQQHMRKAGRLLRSVELRAENDDPDAVASTAYYAMFHATCAIVLQRQGRLPKTHASLIAQFGLIVRDLDAEGRAFGSSLNEAFDRRSTADYSIVIQLTRAEAMKARDKARAFIAYCRKLQRNANS